MLDAKKSKRELGGWVRQGEQKVLRDCTELELTACNFRSKALS